MTSATDIDALVARLRSDDLFNNRGPNYEPYRIPPSALRLEAASALTSLQADLAAARELSADLLASLDPDTLDPEQFNAWSALTAQQGGSSNG